jgi:hypothetical protein
MEIDGSEVKRLHFLPGFHGFYYVPVSRIRGDVCLTRDVAFSSIYSGGKVIKRQDGEIVEHFDAHIKRILLALHGGLW